MANSTESNQIVRFGEFELDLRTGELRSNGRHIILQEKPFQILTALLERPGEMVAREDLIKRLWPAGTFVDFDLGLNKAVNRLREALGDSAEQPRFIETFPKRGYRFVGPVAEVTRVEAVSPQPNIHPGNLIVNQVSQYRVLEVLRQRPRNWIPSSIAVLGLLALAGFFVLQRHSPPPLNATDLVLVADFVNTTGEPVFDGSLKQALTVKLAESPFFNIVSDSATRKTLGLMGHSSDERVLPPMARDVCQRAGAKVEVGGSILSLGNKYVLDLDATNCLTGAKLSHQEIEALNREQVLSKLGQVIPPLRRKLGESVGSIQKFDTPIEQTTTKSLAALKAYTSGDQKRAQGSEAESVPFYKMAIELDPDFAIAYARLGAVYNNLNQPDLSDEYMQKAFERRERVSEREKFYIQAHYYEDTTKELDKANETYKLWAEVYPQDFSSFNSLSSGYIAVGQLEKAIEAGQQGLRVNPNHAIAYASLSRAYERSTRFAEAKAICERAITEKVDSAWTHQVLYRLAFAEGDESAMQRELNWFKGKPQESVARYFQAKAALSKGDLRGSRELFNSARELAAQRGLKEVALAFLNGQAQFEADLGSAKEVPALADQVLRSTSNTARHKAFATLALARAGDAGRAQTLANELSKRATLGTDLSNVVLPSIRAAIDLERRNPAAAIKELQAAVPYDLGSTSGGVTLYYRGLAYLELKSGKEAAAQFQKILDNRGVVVVDIYWPLAHLGLARSYALQGDTVEARRAYQDFLTLWKDADPHIPILKEARAEYAKLQ
jgi:DNA-binding winged helix-turn-helix (wHTH) protein/tetratricopeptide (TPR) repeat protein